MVSQIYLEVGKKEENKNVNISQLSSDGVTMVSPAENNSKAIFIRCITNLQGSVKITIKGEVSISAATVIFKHEIKATAVLFLFGTFLELLIVSSAL